MNHNIQEVIGMSSNEIRIQEIKNIVRNEIREIVREEIRNAWNSSEIPTLALIIEKLNLILKEKNIVQGETSSSKEIEEKEIVPINAWKRGIEPMMMDISKMKPNLPEPVGKTLNKLRELKRQGKF